MDKDKALRMALEALEEPREHIAKHRRLEAITAIKEALAQPEPQWTPVEIGVDVTNEGAHVVGMYVLPDVVRYVFYSKLHPAPQRKPLTDEQWQEIAAITGCLRIEKRGRDAILRVLEEAAHGIKE